MKKFSTDHILSVSAIITAIVAVWIAVVEQQSSREYQRLSVEPYLELSNTNRNGYERLLINTGLGPARIQTVDVKIDGKKISTWREVVKIFTNEDSTKISTGGLWLGRQIQARETVVLVHLRDNEVAQEVYSNISKVNMKICYCSMYKECWIKEDSQLPKAIKECPTNSNTAFPNR